MQPDMLHARRLGCDLNNPMEDSSKDPVKQQAAQSRWWSHNEAKKRAGSF